MSKVALVTGAWNTFYTNVPNIIFNDNEHWCRDQIKNRRKHQLYNS